MNRSSFLKLLLALPFAPELLARFQPAGQAVSEGLVITRGVSAVTVEIEPIIYSTRATTNGNFVVKFNAC